MTCSNSQIFEFIERTVGRAITVVGDIMLDEYVWTRASRISPEAPVQVLDYIRVDHKVGGAGNVAMNLRALDINVKLCGVIGLDDNGRRVRALLKGAGISDSYLVENDFRPTTTKTRILASNQHVTRIDREMKGDIDRALGDQIFQSIVGSEPEAIILSDYNKGVLTKELTVKILSWASAKGIPSIVDPKGNSFEKYQGAYIITPNQDEASVVSRISIDDASVERAARFIQDSYGISNVLITRSEKGMYLLEASGENLSIGTHAREVYDVTGAGDTVVAVLAAGLAGKMTLTKSIQISNMAAGISVSRVGVYAVKPDELLKASSDLQRKRIVGLGDISQVVNIEKALGHRIVFTNGCFDILHVGHIRYLAASKALGDVLIVGINTDSSVRSIKGASRPINSQQDRAFALLGLEAVDYVVFFDDLTPLSLIQVIKPAVITKGTDYKLSEVVGAQFVQSYGGTVELIPLVEGKSTSKLIRSLESTNSVETIY